MHHVTRPLWFLTLLLASTLVLAVGAGPAAADLCVGEIVHEHGDEGEDEHECIIDESSEEFQAVDGTDADADPIGDAISSFEYSANMEPLGFNARNVPFSGTGSAQFNSDLAFQGDYAFQGTYDGFRVLDVSNPASPTQVVNYAGCSSGAGQGDVLVYGNLLIRSWDAAVSSGQAGIARCGGVLVGQGFEGVHIFDISDLANPVLIKQIRMASTNSGPILPGGTYTNGCGSHTATLVPDPARGNLYVYSSGSSGSCTGIDILRIPLGDPAGAGIVRRAAASRQCHDTAVFLADVNLAACAGGNGFSVFSFDPSLSPELPGGLENPTLLYSKPMGISTAHSHSFSWDGEVLIFGHEPGGGSQAQCQATSSTLNRTIFFMEPRTGAELGRYVQPRPQTNRENCTWHNFNVVPTNRGRIAVVGSYQMGISVLDFTDPASVQQLAYADPAPLSTTSTILGGDWSTYWYNGHIFESDIRRGVIIWRLNERVVQGARTFGLSNPQTQTVSFDLDRTKPTVAHNIPATIGLGGTHVVDFSCADADSDIWSCDGTPADGALLDTSSVGTKTYSIRAEDGAGNVETVTGTYEVTWDQFAGLFRPIADGTNAAQAGQAVPVKFSLGADYGLAVLAAGHPMSKPCGADDSALASTTSTGGLQFSDGQYVYVWKTDKEWAGSCRELVVKLLDNTVHTATFQFKG